MLKRLKGCSAFEQKGDIFQPHCNLSFNLRHITCNVEKRHLSEYMRIKIIYRILIHIKRGFAMQENKHKNNEGTPSKTIE